MLTQPPRAIWSSRNRCSLQASKPTGMRHAGGAYPSTSWLLGSPCESLCVTSTASASSCAMARTVTGYASIPPRCRLSPSDSRTSSITVSSLLRAFYPSLTKETGKANTARGVFARSEDADPSSEEEMACACWGFHASTDADEELGPRSRLLRLLCLPQGCRYRFCGGHIFERYADCGEETWQGLRTLNGPRRRGTRSRAAQRSARAVSTATQSGRPSGSRRWASRTAATGSA